MNEVELIEKLYGLLGSNLQVSVNVGTVNTGRPVPSVFIEDWEITDKDLENSNFAGEYTGGQTEVDGTPYERAYVYNWEARVEIVIRHDDQLGASELTAEVCSLLRNLRSQPQELDENLKRVRIVNHGSPSYNFVESKETTEQVIARFHGDHIERLRVGELSADQIESTELDTNFTYNNT